MIQLRYHELIRHKVTKRNNGSGAAAEPSACLFHNPLAKESASTVWIILVLHAELASVRVFLVKGLYHSNLPSTLELVCDVSSSYWTVYKFFASQSQRKYKIIIFFFRRSKRQRNF